MQTRILFIEAGSGSGGSAKILSMLLTHLNEEKFYPVVIAYSCGERIKELMRCGKEVIVKGPRDFGYSEKNSAIIRYLCRTQFFLFSEIPYAFWLVGLILRKKINYIHLNNEIYAHIPAIIAGMITGRKVICQPHGIERLTFIERVFGRFIYRFIMVSEAGAEGYARQIGWDKLVTIYNGIDLKEFDRSVNKAILNSGNFKKVGILGRIDDWKGQDVFIRAAKLTLEKFPYAKFYIIGDDLTSKKAYLKELKKLRSDLQLDNSVIFTGWQKDINSVLKGLDVVVHASTDPEPFGLVIIEAMAAGKPIIATNIGAPPEIIQEGKTGFLSPPGDYKALARYINILLEDNELSQQMGRAGRLRVEENFNINKTVRNIEKFYNTLIQECNKKNFLYDIIKHFICYILYYCGLTQLALKLFIKNKKTVIFMYHKVLEGKSVFSGLPVQVFEKQVDFIRRYFNVVGFPELLAHKNYIKANRAVITFDDGYKNTYDCAFPILKRYGLPATIFLATGLLGNGRLIWTDKISYLVQKTNKPTLTVKIDGYSEKFALLTDKDRKKAIERIKESLKRTNEIIKKEVLAEIEREVSVDPKGISDSQGMLNGQEIGEMAKEAIDFGGHTVNHPILTNIPLEEAWKEIKESKEEIEKHANKPVIAFCYPNGMKEDFNPEIKDLLKRAGYQCAVTAIGGCLNTNDTDLFEIKRLPTYETRMPLFAAKVLFELMK
ncbi:MAG: glycosyltransferase [Candidatus Omnitrophota bacterium]